MLFKKVILTGSVIKNNKYASNFFIIALVSDWKSFEKFVTEVLELHNFAAAWNVNVTLNGVRRQFDIIARKNGAVIGVDCKFWDNKKTKASALIAQALKQKGRCEVLKEVFGINRAIPLIITNKEDLCGNYNEVDIVPLERLNNYLLENY